MALFHNNIQPALHQSSDPVVEAHEGLVIAIVAAAVDNEGIQYLDTYDGQNWLEIIGLDPEGIKTRLLRRIHTYELQEVA
tara:strand:+ start:552 stop:791 length:240 start_codon:yes stop_codon:yes gene_type:complete